MSSSKTRGRVSRKAGASIRAKEAPQVAPAPIHLVNAELTLLTFAGVFLTLQVYTARAQSATWDEPGHITAGYAILTSGDYRLGIEHPPLLRMWMALPLMSMDGVRPDLPAIDPARPENVAFTGPFEAGHTFLRCSFCGAPAATGRG